LTVVACLTVALQLAVLYAPELPGGVPSHVPFGDKVVHAGVFAAAVWAWVCLKRRWAWGVAGVFAVHAGVSEIIQWSLLPGRTGDVWDVVADLAGVALGLWVALRWRWPVTGRPDQTASGKL
jgi:VanZ family protein